MNSKNARAARRGHFLDSTDQSAVRIGYAYQSVRQTYHLRNLPLTVVTQIAAQALAGACKILISRYDPGRD